jgi:ribosomal protein S24E
VGSANVYEKAEQAKFVEPEHIIKRNNPPEKPKEEAT